MDVKGNHDFLRNCRMFRAASLVIDLIKDKGRLLKRYISLLLICVASKAYSELRIKTS